MLVDEFEQHAADAGLIVRRLTINDQTFVHITGIRISGGALDGRECEAAILRSTESPWVPQAAVHVRPHLVTMGEACSQPSPIGADWQYLSRRFDKAPTPRSFLCHIFTVLGSL